MLKTISFDRFNMAAKNITALKEIFPLVETREKIEARRKKKESEAYIVARLNSLLPM